MSQRMIHLLAYRCEDGIIVSINENHVERDGLYEEAQAEWRREGGEGRAPAMRLDTYVPLEATHAQIKNLMGDIMHKIMMRRVLKQLTSVL